MVSKILEVYNVEADNVRIEVQIAEKESEFVRCYFLNLPEYGAGTKALLENLKASIITDSGIKAERMLDSKFLKELKEKFSEKATRLLQKELPDSTPELRATLIGQLLHEMLGLGKIEFLLSDGNLEEIVINSALEPIWVYHKKFGWLKTNIMVSPESEIQNFANIIARRVGKQITTLDPLLDAHLVTGDRANATLFPVSTRGNTITIRRFRRDPWTVTDFIENKTASAELMALVWLAIQYEMNMVISGGTGSGKTSMLNVCMPFIQANNRILSIEDTRELSLPDFLHWVPLTTREANPEGKGEISMLDLLVNSLRMRPDRIIVGEVRRQREAEVMFEAMHTGHSVYTTIHANTSDETIRRLVSPPISIPVAMLDTVHLNLVMFRNRRVGARRVLQLSEFISEKRSESEERVRANVLYRWKPATDEISKHSESIRFYDELAMHTGFTPDEMQKDLADKKSILEWLVKNRIRDIASVGRVIAEYYLDSSQIMSLVEKNRMPAWFERKVFKE